ncbi:hypothetical protein [Streptomyces badius]|uniref:DUF4259 domain-containing protein n=1 Tax=Streptomyces badius TaxID=1941 RepID=A0ABQ2TSI6_STRBA|nr:hypothetical protein [Streptomyces badius]GGS83266.1 hypothetical protein GCM10010253_67310 [Streptomyces badius]
MTIMRLPVPAGPPDDVPPYEPWAGEAEVLSEAAAAGRRAAAWARSLPGPPAPVPVGAWLAGELPDAIETAMGGLDPQDCDRMGPEGTVVEGTGGVDTATMETLAAVSCMVPEAAWLTPDQQVRLLAMAFAVTGSVRLLADDPSGALMHGLLTRMRAVLDHAARPDGALWTGGTEQRS